ncbi:hypothetical protein [Arthrobacter sp. 31Y]|uniref:hypothetical protein n=1 Tax=Arthrobacter sp. 31Y TaxID=1115632 RepID=UPI000463D7D3|nr:hypothetical protein [Arthrobacter sp. 31Y]
MKKFKEYIEKQAPEAETSTPGTTATATGGAGAAGAAATPVKSHSGRGILTLFDSRGTKK